MPKLDKGRVIFSKSRVIFMTVKSLMLTFLLVPTAASAAEIGHMNCIFTDFAQVTISETNRERITQSVEIVDSKTTAATMALDGSMRAVNGTHWVFMPGSPPTAAKPLRFFSDFGEMLTLESRNYIKPGMNVPKGVYPSTLISPAFNAYESHVSFGRCEVQ